MHAPVNGSPVFPGTILGYFGLIKHYLAEFFQFLQFYIFQAFKRALLFPTFLIYSYFSLIFHENALLSLLFHSKMSFRHKNPEIFPCRFAHSHFIN